MDSLPIFVVGLVVGADFRRKNSPPYIITTTRVAGIIYGPAVDATGAPELFWRGYEAARHGLDLMHLDPKIAAACARVGRQ